MACLRHSDPRLLRHLDRPRRIIFPRSAFCAAHRRHLSGHAIRSFDPRWMDRRATHSCEVLIGNGRSDPYQMKPCGLNCDF